MLGQSLKGDEIILIGSDVTASPIEKAFATQSEVSSNPVSGELPSCRFLFTTPVVNHLMHHINQLIMRIRCAGLGLE